MKILVVLVEAYWIAVVISGIARGGFPTNPVFWTATGIEIGLGFLTYNLYKRYLTDKSHKRWNFSILVLTVMAVGVPIALYYSNIDFLKPAGSTWVIYMLACNSFYVYRVIRKQPLSRGDLPKRRWLTASKIVYSLFLAAILIGSLIVALLPILGFVPEFSSQNGDLPIIEVVLCIFSLLCLNIGFYLPRLIG